MTRNEVKAAQSKYNGRILRNPVTSEAWGVMIESAELIPELDKYADHATDDVLPCGVERMLIADEYRYTILCPVTWFDLGGWADE